MDEPVVHWHERRHQQEGEMDPGKEPGGMGGKDKPHYSFLDYSETHRPCH